MSAQCPLLVANTVPAAEHIRTSLTNLLGFPIHSCTYDNYRSIISWHKKGNVVLLATGENGDTKAAATFVQELRLRRSPMDVAVVQIGLNPEPLSWPDAFDIRRIRWPEGAADLANMLRGTSAFMPNEESLESVLAGRLASHTPSLLSQVSRLALAASHDLTVLLTGETGTGKTYLARLLHEHSPRRQYPFLMVPCGAQPSNLFESTFFGHVKGAYTGAHQSRMGRFAAAGKGTILLDEIDALALEQQASMLRVIETGEYELVGGNETLHSEARIIVASNTDLEERVAQGTFRQDLFYRLNVLSFHLPPLRKRRQDIPLLARATVARFNAKFGKDLYRISDDVLRTLEEYDWPGNIRQLENVLQEAVLVSNGSDLTLRDLPALPASNISADNSLLGTFPLNGSENGHADDKQDHTQGDTLLRGRAAFERTLIQKALADCEFNRSRAARALGISRVTLYKKLKQYSLSHLPRR